MSLFVRSFSAIWVLLHHLTYSVIIRVSYYSISPIQTLILRLGHLWCNAPWRFAQCVANPATARKQNLLRLIVRFFLRFLSKQNKVNSKNWGETNFEVPKKQKDVWDELKRGIMVIEISIITPCTSCTHLWKKHHLVMKHAHHLLSFSFFYGWHGWDFPSCSFRGRSAGKQLKSPWFSDWVAVSNGQTTSQALKATFVSRVPVHCITPFCSDALVSPPNLYPPWL